MAAPSTLLESSQEYDYEWVRTLWNDANISRYLDVLSLFSDSTEATESVMATAEAIERFARQPFQKRDSNFQWQATVGHASP
jgi:hypothetical protein